MNKDRPQTRIADHRHVGAVCPRCQEAVATADRIIVCLDCGVVHHESCWDCGGCAAYACAPAQHQLGEEVKPSIVINHHDLNQATSPRMASPAARLHSPAMLGQDAPSLPNAIRQPISSFAVIAFGVSLCGIPFLGLMLLGRATLGNMPIHLATMFLGITGVFLGAIAIGHIQIKRRRGTLFAVSGVFIGLGNMMGWVVAMVLATSISGGTRVANVHFSNQTPELTTIAEMSEVLQRAMRANVVVKSNSGWGPLAQSLGSGVIVRTANARAYILTNRHVIDSKYRESLSDQTLPKDAKVMVEMLGQRPRDAIIHWVAPHGVDIALISTDLFTDEAVMTKWKPQNKIQVGGDVFGVGNPCDLSWSQTKGSISQIRKQQSQGHEISVIQTDVAISSGNSGGGLYDEEGFLIGINTWTTDKAISEGLSFAISVNSIFALSPPIPNEGKD